MMAHKASRVVPKLRFPEFRNAADWKTKILGSQGNFLSSLTGKTAMDFDTGDAAFIPYMNVFSNTFTNTTDLRSVNVADNESQSAVAKGDVFFTVSSETSEEAGMSSVLLEEIRDCYLNSFCALFRFDKGKSPDPVFLGFLLRSAPAREHLSSRAQGATRYNISRATFRSLPILIPSGPEQKKIADCLGSLDDLIAAEGRKLESLRQHKQGLMQQLFPQAGKTQPRLRFPEFQDTQEWRVVPLGKLFETTTGGTPNRARADYWGGEVPWVTTSIIDFNVIESTRESISSAGLSNSSAKVFPKRTVLMALYGQGKTRGKVAMLGIEAATNQACAAILPSDEVDPRFVFLNLSGRYEEIRANSNSGGQKNLSQALVRALPFAYPKEPSEQHRIAECLTVLDDLIAAQARKLETLKQHKHGLLQQLFPKPETE